MQNTFKERVAQVLAGEYAEFDTVPVCATPQLIRDIGFTDGEIVITQKHIRNCLAPEDTATDKEHHHDLPIDFMDNLPQYIENPAMILSSLTQSDSVVLVTDCKDKKDRPIIVALKNDGIGRSDGRLISCNVLTSTYGRNGFVDFLNSSIQQNGLLYFDEKKSRNLVVSAGLQLPRVLAKYDSNVIIRRYDDNVNPLSQNNLDFSPDGYGTSLFRPDKTPFAYSDPDGRQKLYEYTKDRNGKEFLQSITATFSDGRSEITRYDERGTVTGIERKDASGRTTYKYSHGWSGTREASYEYFDVKYPYYDVDWEYRKPYKSKHEKEHTEEMGRYSTHHKYKENWHEKDGNGKTTLSKHNEYRADGITPEKYYCREDRYEYDRDGGCTSEIGKSIKGTEIVKREYYRAQDWLDYYNLTAEDTDGEYERPIKSRTYLRADGSMSYEKYEISGEYTALEFAPSGKLAEFRDKNGARHKGQAAVQAYVKSTGGSTSSFAEIAAATKACRPQASGKKNGGKPSGSGSDGAGR